MANVRIKNGKGEQGGDYIDSALGATTGEWLSGVCLLETVISAITQPNFTNSDMITTQTLPAGTVVYGLTTSITLTSGLIQMFNAEDPRRLTAIQG